MKKIVYSETDINTLCLILEQITVKGISQAKLLVSAGNILDKGKKEDVPEKSDENVNGKEK